MIAAKLGVPSQKSDELLSPTALSTTMITRALAAGKSQAEIDEALKD
jgi:hypothetical protein